MVPGVLCSTTEIKSVTIHGAENFSSGTNFSFISTEIICITNKGSYNSESWGRCEGSTSITCSFSSCDSNAMEGSPAYHFRSHADEPFESDENREPPIDLMTRKMDTFFKKRDSGTAISTFSDEADHEVELEVLEVGQRSERPAGKLRLSGSSTAQCHKGVLCKTKPVFCPCICSHFLHQSGEGEAFELKDTNNKTSAAVAEERRLT
ncbi:hypothetical protein KIL84_006994 [Mauremys mutica]|uniref:Uncharacterized protein n=1 Tax=Mauremys mutica TaxID=74926 RepID=A0A9D4AWK6_9SAUR|nr:hypothetical protein KIL84_006994 [Mauremys mutica]